MDITFTTRIVLPWTQIRFSIGRERATCHVSRVMRQKPLTPKGNNNPQVISSGILLKLQQILCSSWRQANNSFYSVCSVFELGGTRKHLMTGPMGNSEFCFPSTLNIHLGEQISLISKYIDSRGETKLGAAHSGKAFKALDSVGWEDYTSCYFKPQEWKRK